MSKPTIVTEPPGPKSLELMARAEALMHRSFGADQSVPFVLDHKDGWLLHDVDGNSFVDCVSGWGSTPLGANYPDVSEAVTAGLGRYALENSDYIFSEPLIDLATRLVAMTPSNLTRVSYDVSGTEAVETAAKLMREATRRPYIISFFGQYHGESYTGQSLSAQRSDFSPRLRHLTPGVLHVPFPHPYRCPFEHPGDFCDGICVVSYIADYLTFHLVAAEEIAGIFIEPVLGEGGVLAPPDAFWPAMSDLCEENNWLMCLDEVETGFGRTGTMFAADRWNVQPDLMCLAKALSGGGLPIGAVMMSEAVAKATAEVHTGGTWAGQPAACMGAIASLEAFDRDDILGHVARLSQIAEDQLRPLEDLDIVGEVRIVGLYVAIDFVSDKSSKTRAPYLALAVHEHALHKGVVGIEDDVSHYRILPALNMPDDLFSFTVSTIADAVRSVDDDHRSGAISDS